MSRTTSATSPVATGKALAFRCHFTVFRCLSPRFYCSLFAHDGEMKLDGQSFTQPSEPTTRGFAAGDVMRLEFDSQSSAFR